MPATTPANTVLSPDCDGKRGDKFNKYFFPAPAVVPCQSGGEGAIGLPTIGPLASTLFALPEYSDAIECTDRLAVRILYND